MPSDKPLGLKYNPHEVEILDEVAKPMLRIDLECATQTALATCAEYAEIAYDLAEAFVKERRKRVHYQREDA